MMTISINSKPYFRKWVAAENLCSFCATNKPDSQVILGHHNLKICRACVSLCNEIIADRDKRAKSDSMMAMADIEKKLPEAYQPHELINDIYDAVAAGEIPGLRVDQ